MSDNLFQRGRFMLASGKVSTWKIECDALTLEDWEGLAEMAAQTVLKGMRFSRIEGVPRGGLPFADALRGVLEHDAGGPVLLVEDVVTTGGSIIRHGQSLGLLPAPRHPKDLSPILPEAAPEVVGVCFVARGRCPSWVRPLFRTPEDATP